MSFITSQQIDKYLELYGDVSLPFSKEVVEVLSFEVKQVHIRASGGQWPCIVHSASMQGAKIICNKSSPLLNHLSTKGVSNSSLRFSFADEDSKEPVAFFVTVRLIGVSDYQPPDIMLVSLAYTQRAPDALIERLGKVISASVNAKRFPNEHIAITDANMRRIALTRKESVIFIDGVPRRCILQSISFAGAKVYMMGVAVFLRNKTVTLKFEFSDPALSLSLKGKTVEANPLEDRKDLVSLIIEFEPPKIPINYKIYLSRYFELPRKLVATETEGND